VASTSDQHIEIVIGPRTDRIVQHIRLNNLVQSILACVQLPLLRDR
jgi:hypothetical protein